MAVNNKEPKFCQTCGEKNDSSANFCDKCGTKLLKLDLDSKTDNNPLNMIRNFRNFINNNKRLVIIISSLFVLTLMANYIIGITPSSQGSEIVPYGNDTGTFYDSEYLSFSHNKMYKIDTGDKNFKSDDNKVPEIFNGWAYPKNVKKLPNGENWGTNFTFGVTVYKPINATKSAYDYALSDKNFDDKIESTNSINSIQIADVTGYEYDSNNLDSDSPTKYRNIFFVKNGLLYHIRFFCDLNKINKYQEDINKIINSFTIK